MTSMTWWILIFIATVLAELSSPGLFFFISISGGALVAALVSWFDISLMGEFLVFLAVSGGLFYLLRRYVTRMKDTLHATNVYALVGKKGIVVEELSEFTKGWVKLDGELWAAVPSKGERIEVGTSIEVVSAAGSHVVVRTLN